MTLTAMEIANTQAAGFDVQHRYYAGGLYDAVDMSDFANKAMPVGWAASSDGSTVTPASGWTEITNRVHFAGTFTSEQQGSSITWQASLSGQTYSDAYLGVGRAIVCLARYKRTDQTRWQYWQLLFIGQVTEGDYQDNYKLGGAWSRTITGKNASLERTDAPRLTAGPVNLALDASVSASSTLAQPALESGNGEFVGTVANVDPENAVDDSLYSVWISEGIPGVTPETPATPSAAQILHINEIFMWPPTGYPVESTWWLEIYYSGDPVNGDGSPINMHNYWLVNQDGCELHFNHAHSIPDHGYGVVCADKALFERYTGGAPNAGFVVEAKSMATRHVTTGAQMRFTLRPEQGFLYLNRLKSGSFNWNSGNWTDTGDGGAGCYDVVAWYDGAAGWTPTIPEWSGEAVHTEAITTGHSIGRVPSGTNAHSNETSGTKTGWYDIEYPTPGRRVAELENEWLYVDLGTFESALSQDVAASALEIPLTDTTGWLDAGRGIIDSDTFAYTGRTPSALTGVSGVGSAHVKGTAVWPTDKTGNILYGKPISAITIERRPGLSTIERGEVRFLANSTGLVDGRTPDDTGWESDYDPDYITINNAQTIDKRIEYGWNIDSERRLGSLVYSFGHRDEGYRRFRAMLIIIRNMSDGGRAKINRITATLSQLALDTSGLGDIDGARSADIARYLVRDVYGNEGADYNSFIDCTTPPVGRCGYHATAVAPYTRVLDSLAQATGCLVLYDTDGSVKWLPDPWWPFGPGEEYPDYTFEAASIRGDIQMRQSRPNVTAVAVTAVKSDGSESWRFVYPPGGDGVGSQVQEMTDFVVPDYTALRFLAEALYFRTVGLHYSDTTEAVQHGVNMVTLSVKGVADWLRPGMWVGLSWDWNRDGSVGSDEFDTWYVERVSTTWTRTHGSEKAHETVVEMRRFWR